MARLHAAAPASLPALLLTLGVTLTLGACAQVGEVGGIGAPEPDAGTNPVVVGSRGGGSGSGPVSTGLPCDVQALLAAHCTLCHGVKPLAGVPMSLVTYADLTAPAKSDPTRTVAAMALARMQDAARPMPPAPGSVTGTELTAFNNWVKGGFTAPACGGSTSTGGSTGTTGTGGATGSGSGNAGTSGQGTADGGVGSAANGLPCDVSALLANRCTTCHGTTPLAGVPMPLVTYADLTAPAKSDPTRTVAQMAVTRMRSTSAPMPPAPGTPATSTEIASVDSWIAAGYPKGTCGGSTGGGGSGGGADAGTGGPDPFSVPPTCTSRVMWNGGNSGSSVMNPGLACITCHTSSGGEAPRFSLAGTLYPTAHEYDRCNGVNGSTTGAQVVIVGANGQTITLTPNSAGNFYYTGSVSTPFRAKVTYMGRERIMSTPQTSGDCNKCHTQSGANMAPGRILLP